MTIGRADASTMPARVLFAIPCYWPAISYGGPVEKARRLALALRRRGLEISVVTSNLLDMRSRMPGRTTERLIEGTRVTYLHAPLRYRWTPFTPGAIPWAMRNVRSFDAVHIFGYRDPIGLVVAAAARRLAKPVLFEPLGMLPRSGRSQLLKQVFDASLARWVPKWATLVIANSELERRRLTEGGIPPAKLVVRPNGVAVEEFHDLPPRGHLRRRLGIPESAPLMLFLGRVSRQKTLPLLVRAVSQVPEAHLVIAGPSDDDGALPETTVAARNQHAGDRIHVIGLVDERGRREALADADALALVSSSESFGNAAAEGLAAGLPVVVTKTTGVAEYVNGAGLVVDFSDQAIQDAVGTILSQPSTRARLAGSARVTAAKLSWEEVSATQAELYARAATRLRSLGESRRS